MAAAAPCGGGDPERATVRRPDVTAGKMLDCHLLYTSVEVIYGLSMAGTPSVWVRYRAYREYESARQTANNAMMALMAGSKLALHVLTLTSGSPQMLPDIFPGVDHLAHFRLRTDAATDLLEDAPQHLGAVSIPYALAIHEDFVKSTVDVAVSVGFTLNAPGKNADHTKNPVDASNMHEAVLETISGSTPLTPREERDMELFHLLREMRNSHIHGAGLARPRLIKTIASLSADASANWLRIARRDSANIVDSDGRVTFSMYDIFAAFAVTKAMGRHVNNWMRDNVPLDAWATICVNDYAAISTKARRSNQWLQGLDGFGSQYYKKTGLTLPDLTKAAIAADFWSPGSPYVPRRSARNPPRRPEVRI
jgi:hypothetical protein